MLNLSHEQKRLSRYFDELDALKEEYKLNKGTDRAYVQSRINAIKSILSVQVELFAAVERANPDEYECLTLAIKCRDMLISRLKKGEIELSDKESEILQLIKCKAGNRDFINSVFAQECKKRRSIEPKYRKGIEFVLSK